MEVRTIFLVVACVSAGFAGTCMTISWQARQAALGRRRALRRSTVSTSDGDMNPSGCPGLIVQYVVRLSSRLSFGVTRPLVSFTKRERSAQTSASLWFDSHAGKAGIATSATYEGYREARVRLACILAMGGVVIGTIFSGELAIVLGVGGAMGGVIALPWAIRCIVRQRTDEVERSLSEMLEVVALGLRSGLSFDRSFGLYGMHFSSPLAHACVSTQRRWSLGLTTREEALRDLAASYDSDQLARVIENIVRSLRFGSSLAEILDATAVEARSDHRAHMEERVAKAPVKMMMPTGALILPAMLLLVLGPMLLELAEGW